MNIYLFIMEKEELYMIKLRIIYGYLFNKTWKVKLGK